MEKVTPANNQDLFKVYRVSTSKTTNNSKIYENSCCIDDANNIVCRMAEGRNVSILFRVYDNVNYYF